MIKDFFTHHPMDIDPSLLVQLHESHDILTAWQVINFFCMMADGERVMENVRKTQTDLDNLEKTIQRIIPLVRASKIRSEDHIVEKRKTNLFDRRAQLLIENSRLLSNKDRWKLLEKAVLARIDISTLIDRLSDATQNKRSPKEIIQYLETSPLGLHPDVKLYLESLSPTRNDLWEEKFGISLSAEDTELQAQLEPYFTVMNELIVLNPTIGTYLTEFEAGSDEYYVAALDLLSLVEVESVYKLFVHHTNESDFQIRVLQLLSWAAGAYGIPNESYQALIQYLFELSQEEFISFLKMNEGVVDVEALKIFIPQTLDTVMGNGRLPNFKSKNYKLLVLRLLNSSAYSLVELAREQEIKLPDDNTSIVPEDTFHRLLGEDDYAIWLENQEIVIRALRDGLEKKKWKNVRWTRKETELILIFISYQKRNWGPGGMSESDKIHFVKNLLEPTRLFQRNTERV